MKVDKNRKVLWRSSLETLLSNKEKQIYWKIIHNAVFAEYKLSLMGTSDGKCHFCNTQIEYLTHLFYECTVIQEMLVNIQNKINSTLQGKGHEHIHFDLKTVMPGFERNEDCVRTYLNTVLHIVKWERWKLRNLIKYESKSYSVKTILKSILTKIASCCKFWKATKIAEKYGYVLDLLAQLQ